MTDLMKKWLAVLMLPMLLIAAPAAEAKEESALGLRVDAAILLDAESGKILYEENADKSLGIASMTKMLTEYLLFEAIEEGTITWDQEYRVNGYTYAISQDRRLSNVPLRRDGTYTIRELYEAVAIYSANAATIGIAETIAGSEEKFVKMMNEKAQELGLTDYKIVNSTGLNNSDLQGMHPKNTGERDENVMPARSVGKLAYHLLHDFPEVLDTAKVSKKTFREGTSDAIEMINWNFMLPGLIYEYEGVDGLKTGTTEFAGHCFTGTAVKGDKRLIAVVMNAVDEKGIGSYEARFNETRILLDYGFNEFENEELLPQGYQFENQKTIDIIKGKAKKVGIAAQEPVSMLIKKGEKDEYEPQLTLSDERLVKEGKLTAPVKEGTVIGHIQLVKKNGGDYGFIDGKTAGTEVAVTGSVEKAGWFPLAVSAIGEFASNAWNSSAGFVKGIFK